MDGVFARPGILIEERALELVKVNAEQAIAVGLSLISLINTERRAFCCSWTYATKGTAERALADAGAYYPSESLDYCWFLSTVFG